MGVSANFVSSGIKRGWYEYEEAGDTRFYWELSTVGAKNFVLKLTTSRDQCQRHAEYFEPHGAHVQLVLTLDAIKFAIINTSFI
jgi:hypothetical protein